MGTTTLQSYVQLLIHHQRIEETSRSSPSTTQYLTNGHHVVVTRYPSCASKLHVLTILCTVLIHHECFEETSTRTVGPEVLSAPTTSFY